MADSRYVFHDHITFEGLDDLPNQVFNILLENEDLFKLLYYIGADRDPLSQPDLTRDQKLSLLQPEMIDEDNNIRNNPRIQFFPYSSDITQEDQCQLRIYINNTRLISDDLTNADIGFDVICNNDIMAIKKSNRALRTAIEVTRTLNGYLGTESIGQLRIPFGSGLSRIKWNNEFQGYTLNIRGRWSDKGESRK